MKLSYSISFFFNVFFDLLGNILWHEVIYEFSIKRDAN
jgi:hypothetical protein